MFTRRIPCAIAMCLMLFAITGSYAQTNSYPTKLITVLVPFPPGGNVDLSTRIVTQRMAEILKQSFIIENRAGAGGLITYDAIAHANPDGYTLASMAASSLIVTPRFNDRKDLRLEAFTPIGAMSDTPLVLEVGANSRFKNVQDFLKYAKDHPGEISIAHSGTGTTAHVAILLLEQATGITFNIIPYRGASPALIGLLGGQVDAMVDQFSSSLQHIQSKKLRALAVASKSRAAEMPDVATLHEAGVKIYSSAVTGLVAPAGIPADVSNKLNRALNLALQDPGVQKRFKDLGSTPLPTTVQEFKALLADEDSKAADLITRGVLRKD